MSRFHYMPRVFAFPRAFACAFPWRNLYKRMLSQLSTREAIRKGFLTTTYIRKKSLPFDAPRMVWARISYECMGVAAH